MTNNLAVSLTTFALGVTAGVGTVLMLAFNGLLFGVISGACWHAGMLGQLTSFVAPHGVIELPAIFIAGGAGLLLAKGLLFPGTLPRRASLALEGGRAVRLVLGIIPMLIVAGTIEGFVSPSDLAGEMEIHSRRRIVRLASALRDAKGPEDLRASAATGRDSSQSTGNGRVAAVRGYSRLRSFTSRYRLTSAVDIREASTSKVSAPC